MRLATTLLAAGVLVGVVMPAACLPQEPPPPVTTPTTDPTRAALEQARQTLAPAVRDLAEVLLPLADDVDDVRHIVDRGDDFRVGVELLEARRDELAERTARLQAAVATVDDLTEGAEAVMAAQGLVEAATRAEEALADEVAHLTRLAAFDADLLAVADAWDEPGSQRERREALQALGAEITQLQVRARRLPSHPPGCTTARSNRVRWAARARERTLALLEVAHGGTGTAYDELRERYRSAPFGEDLAVADSEGRACWERASPLPDLVTRAQQAVDAVATALE